ncbi:general amidase GmdA [Penicillium manginii]|uniref:general amidase GmdA n=1 Tax=Penicillium manginii TaxID=203109 RepID=UPI0025484EC1|nr:general amidase GmdA [Penicillium manginii]KAJ5755878.1 general amidase GmdA [Penicillium manginii]
MPPHSSISAKSTRPERKIMVHRLSSWQETAAAKRQAISNAIPEHWRIPSSRIPAVEKQPDVTSCYIHHAMAPRDIEITEADAVTITQHKTVAPAI